MTAAREFELDEILAPIIAALDKKDKKLVEEKLNDFSDEYYFVDFSEDDWDYITPKLNDARLFLTQ